MDKEITVPRFCNYTDLRDKKEISAIEAETIKNYARSLSTEEMEIFLAEVPYEQLSMAMSRQFYDLRYRFEGMKRCLQ